MTALERLTAICEMLDDASYQPKGDHVIFRRKRKVFAYFLNDHHGDGIVSVCVKVLPGDNERLIQSDAKRFYSPAYIGSRGWVAYRLDEPKPDWSEVKELVKGSHQLTQQPSTP